MWRFPRLPAMPRLYLGPWAWMFFGLFLLAFYFCWVILWLEVMLVVWIGRGVYFTAVWAYRKVKDRCTEHA
jgi:hypothetical protein